jgi:toxin ParE1/3/4
LSRVVRRDSALRELADIIDYLAERSPSAAGRFVTAVEQACTLLSEMPLLGSPWLARRPELAGLRTWRPGRFKNYVVFYRPIADGIEVLHITHGARDLDRLLGDSP